MGEQITSDDHCTYYYEVFPSNNLEWIVDGSWANDASGDKPNWVDTQNEVVKEEKRRFDNSPYGQIIPEVKKKISSPLSLDDCWLNGSFRRCNTNWISRLQ
jgi:hypothetical protein